MLQYLTIGKFELPMYGLMIMIGAVLAVAFAMRRAKQTTISPDDVLYSITYTALGVILGAKLLYVIVSWNQLSGNWSYYFSSFKAFREFVPFDDSSKWNLRDFAFPGGVRAAVVVGEHEIVREMVHEAAAWNEADKKNHADDDGELLAG